MRLRDAQVTVSGVARNHLAGEPSRGHPLVALSELQWSASVVLAAGVGLAMLTLAAGPYSHAPGNGVVLALLVCGPILALRRWALPVLAVTAAATAVVMAGGNAPLPFGLMLGLAVYLVASRLPRRWSVPAAAVTAAALGAALVYVVIAVPRAAPAGEAVIGLVPVAAAWFIGDSVAARRRYLAGLAEQAERERAAEAERARQDVREERVRIARELHDVVAHTLAVITVQAGVGRRLMARRPEEAAIALDSIETIGPAALTPAPRLVDIKELVHTVQASGTPVELRTSDADRQLSPALELSIYRVVQEALTNVVKHAPGARATVDLAVSDQAVRIEITDDGGPARLPGDVASPDAVAGPDLGHGIVGMRERTGAFGGWLVAEPLPGRGFHVLAEIPLEGAA